MSKRPIRIPTYCDPNSQVILESVYYEGEPRFLQWDGKEFTLTTDYTTPTETIVPLEQKQGQLDFPYRAYEVTDEGLERLNHHDLTSEEAFQSLLDIYTDFVDNDDVYLTLEALSDMLSYQQHKVMTVPYLYLFGPKGSGKTNRCTVHNNLAYRPFSSVRVTSANIYTYLGAYEEGAGTIIEDEFVSARGEVDQDKIQIYLAGYKKGLSVSRIAFHAGKRRQEHFKMFSVKWFAGRQLPRDDNFLDRCIVYPIYRGSPPKDAFTEADEQRFGHLRVLLLGWRMKTYFEPLPELNINIPGRLKELFRPLFLVGHGVPGAKGHLMALFQLHEEEKKREVLDDPEYWMVKAVRTAISKYGNPLPFHRIWNMLADVSGADSGPRGRLVVPEWDVSKTRLGRTLSKLLQGRKTRKRDEHGNTETFYRFDMENLDRLWSSYAPSDLEGEE